MQEALSSKNEPRAEQEAAASGGLLHMAVVAAPYIALAAAWTAMSGSLFFSEVWGWLPCVLCWYQRILMYPLTLIITVGILRHDQALPAYVLPFTLLGMGTSLYHYMLVKTDLFPPPPCSVGIPCTTEYLNLFGFINIPFLALTAFAIISVMMALMSIAPTTDEDAEADIDEATPPARGILIPAVATGSIIALIVGTTLVVSNRELQRMEELYGVIQMWLF
ncbi:MAG: disulfide bond formation protein B [Chloroflexaceae bacterium]|nr:disulfide bond formation protein B [Chloroflexaceae bacterium]NJL35130.1 disulfide bond formation protein B [Chloroflexaceae bacterium]NJO06997.1 disulfide bond formation protein B [Chloroflexaceae bacterium]